MIRAWRIAKARYASEAFSGTGGLSVEGRWHFKGNRVIYSASSLALAALEVFVHLYRAHARIRWVAFEVDIPEFVRVTNLPVRQLPRDWRHEPPHAGTMKIGSDWIQGGTTAVLRTPSVIIPTECNYILNPAHPEFRNLRIGPAVPFSFDSRMWK
ncbi:MAG: RES family NAD+ phosphorylase [Betaproteobacteria bacterium]|nr:RES family NAD+ phosphorylase [Gammaproteobacteria bacterium]MDH3438312.1 RES family NAD+ phosphorylase [Betaproteobacteria bacterium]